MVTKTKENLTEKELLKLKSAQKKIISRLVSGSFSKTKKLDKDKTQMILDNFPLAVHIAKKYYRREYDIQDLVQVAAIGLIKAVYKYKANKKNKFSNYAIPTIEGEIRHFLRDNFYGIKISRKCVELNAKIQKYREEYLYKYGREISMQDLAKAFKLKVKDIERIIETVRAHSTISLDAPIASLRGMSKDTDSLSKLEDLIGHESRAERIIELEGLRDALNTLSARDRVIMKDHFIRELSQEEIAKKFNITQAQISRIISSCCQKMRKAMM